MVEWFRDIHGRWITHRCICCAAKGSMSLGARGVQWKSTVGHNCQVYWISRCKTISFLEISVLILPGAQSSTVLVCAHHGCCPAVLSCSQSSCCQIEGCWRPSRSEHAWKVSQGEIMEHNFGTRPATTQLMQNKLTNMDHAGKVVDAWNIMIYVDWY